MTPPLTLAQRLSALQINAPILNPDAVTEIHAALIAVVSAAFEMRQGNGFSCEYTEKQGDAMDDALASLGAAIEKAEG